MKKIFFAFTLTSYCSFGATDTALLAKILGQSVSQLKELKEIWEINSQTLSEIEKANRKVQQARYQILRTKYIVDSAKTLQHTNIQNSQDAINYMRKAKKIKNNSEDLFDDVASLSPEDRSKLIEELDKADEDVKTIQGRILAQKKALLENRVNSQRIKSNQEEMKKYDVLTQINEEASSGAISPQSAAVETAKNTAISNRLLLNSSNIQAEQLKETYRTNKLLEQKELRSIQKEAELEKLWGKRKEGLE